MTSETPMTKWLRASSTGKRGLRQLVKAGEITPSEALQALIGIDNSPSPKMVEWLKRRGATMSKS